MSDEKGTDVSIYPLLMVNFIGTMGISLVLPFLIFLVERFGGNALVYGLLSSMYPFFQLIGSPLLGKWSDIYGRKKILFVSQAGTLLSWILFFIALFVPVTILTNIDSGLLGKFMITIPLLMLFFARGLDGLTGGNVSVSNAYIADISTDQTRSSNFGKLSISTNLGFILGPALAGILSVTVYGEALPVLAAILIALAGLIMITLYIPETRKNKPDANNDPGNVNSRSINVTSPNVNHKKGIRDVWKMTDLRLMFIIYFLIFLGFNTFYTAFPVHAANYLQWSIAELGFFFSFLSIVLVIVEGPVLSYVSKRSRDSTMIIGGSFILGLNFVVLTFGTTFLTYVAAVLLALGNGLMWPSIQSMLARLAGKDDQGLVQGVSGSVMSFAGIFGLIGGGFVYGLVGRWSFILTAAIIGCVVLLSMRLRSFDAPAGQE
ncbi:MAG: transporter, family, tetracycline resistance protein [Methanolobus sp.]|jgi:MFS family permease|nr:transporter, family, tetracycline resistance protein [Methanolobus sp.]MDK2947341.1 transporter, family, tetracycline resistance protein [Methanolobus sp.]